MYQIFDEVSSPAASGERVKALQRELKSRKLKGFLVPHSDEHQDEFLAPPAERLAWLTGFTGSAGVAIVLEKAAALFVDGRYTLQARAQTDATLFEVLQTPDAKASSWIAEKLGKGATIGYDPALHTIKEIERLTEASARPASSSLPSRATHRRLWQDRPKPSPPDRAARARICGRRAQGQDPRRAGALKDEKIDAVLLDHAGFHRLAVQHPRRRHQTHAGRARLCHRAGERQADAVHRLPPRSATMCKRHLARVSRSRRARRADGEAQGAGRSARPRAARSRHGADQVRAGARGRRRKIRAGADPCIHPKAIKNEVEIKGARAAHLRDGVAMARFLAWLDEVAESGKVDEIAAAMKLER